MEQSDQLNGDIAGRVARDKEPEASAPTDRARGTALRSEHSESADNEPTEQELFERNLRMYRALLESPVVVKAVEVWGHRFDVQPEKAKLDHEYRMKAQEHNAVFYASNRKYFLWGLALCLVFLGGVIWILQDDKDTLLPVLTAVVGLLAGAGGGFIFGQSKREI